MHPTRTYPVLVSRFLFFSLFNCSVYHNVDESIS